MIKTEKKENITKIVDDISKFPLSIFYITCPNYTVAQKISYALIENKLSACANIIGGENAQVITSIYVWKGKIEKDNEHLIILKSRTALLDEIVSTVKINHPYEVPEIIAMPIMGGSKDYIQWIYDNKNYYLKLKTILLKQNHILVYRINFNSRTYKSVFFFKSS